MCMYTYIYIYIYMYSIFKIPIWEMVHLRKPISQGLLASLGGRNIYT